MNFVRKKKRGITGKNHKVWFSECGQYRVTWLREAFGVRVKPHFHACVRCLPTIEARAKDHDQWEFAGRRGPYKTFEAAVEACEHHQKVWLEAISLSEGERTGRSDALRSLEFRSRLRIVRKKGKTKNIAYQKIMGSIPVWVRGKANSILINHFFPRSRRRVEEDDEDECPSVPTPVSSSSAPDSLGLTVSSVESSIPASPAKAGEKSSIPAASASTRRQRNTSSATSVEVAAKAPAKRALKRTAKSSKTGGKKNSKRSTRTSSAKVPLKS